MDHLHIGLGAGERTQAKRLLVGRGQRHPFAPARIDEIARREHGGHAAAPSRSTSSAGGCRPGPRAERRPYSRAPRPPARVSASTGPIAAAARCARQAIGRTVPFDRERLGIRSRQAPAGQGGVPVAVRLGFATCGSRCSDLAAGQTQQQRRTRLVGAIDQLVVRLVVVGEQAAVAALDAVGVVILGESSAGSAAAIAASSSR